jgi:nucleoside 2-deoxyribosyltransferase
VKQIYLIGSLRNPEIPVLGNYLREIGFNVFDDWFAGGKIADDEWQAYETKRGRPYDVALRGKAAQHVYHFDLYHIDDSDIGVLALPAGKSGHLELGYMIGSGKHGYVLFDKEPERWDVMYNFAHGVFFDKKDLAKRLLEDHK